MGLCCKANLKRLGCCSERHLLLMIKLTYSSSGRHRGVVWFQTQWQVQVGSQREKVLFAYIQQGWRFYCQERPSRMCFQMPLTDGFFFFFTINDDNSHNKVLPTHEEPQGMHGHLVSHPFTCFSFYIFQKAKAKIKASFPKDTF